MLGNHRGPHYPWNPLRWWKCSVLRSVVALAECGCEHLRARDYEMWPEWPKNWVFRLPWRAATASVQKHLVAEGNPEGYLAVYPGSCVGSGHVQVSEVLLLTVSPKHSLLLVFFQPEFVCILPCHGAASFKVGITICNRKKKKPL